MIRLHVFPETPARGATYACAEIRLLRPYQHPAWQGRLDVTAGRRLPPGRLDAAILQRAGWPDASLDDIASAVREVRQRGAKLLYDIDDDLLSEHPVLEVEAKLKPARPHVRLLLREADAVVVSTPLLGERVRRLNPVVFVWPNALDERLAGERHAAVEADGADIGYFGTLSHLPDLLAIVAPLEAGLDGFARRPVAEFCGVSADPRIGDLLAAQCDVRLLPIEATYAAFHARLQRSPRWKVGLAPLADAAFNRCKSDIKFLDYALAGIPGVYPDCPAYEAVSDGATGLKVTLPAFGAAVRRLLEDADLRASIRTAARTYVLEERVLARRVPDLSDILQSVL